MIRTRAVARCTVDDRGEDRVFRAVVSTPKGQFEVETTADVPLSKSHSVMVPALLPVAMHQGVDVEMDGVPDEAQLSNLQHAQRLLLSWYGHLDPVVLRVDAVAITGDRAVTAPAAGVGCFFSGGVDSFYSVLDHPEVTHLIFVIGFDIASDNHALADATLVEVRAAADSLGKFLIVVRTDIRVMSERLGLLWGPLYHGAAMAHVGLALADHVGRIIIPSSRVPDANPPWGTHLELDRWWSTGRVRFEHDSIEVNRPGKIARLARDPVAMKHLRVCWVNFDGAYNCGRCEKCLRTMLSLLAVGARCEKFPDVIDVDAVRRLRLTDGEARAMTRNVVALQKGQGDHAELLDAMKRSVVASERVWARFFRTYDWFASGAYRRSLTPSRWVRGGSRPRR